jgi:hypothetical protein
MRDIQLHLQRRFENDVPQEFLGYLQHRFRQNYRCSSLNGEWRVGTGAPRPKRPEPACFF